MPADTNKLSDMQLRNLKLPPSPRKLSDGGGLYVLLTTTGKRLFRHNLRYEGKQLTLSYGQWPAVSLAEARKARDRSKELLALGQDPRTAGDGEASGPADTFRAVADRWLESQEQNCSPRTLQRIRSRIETNLYPQLGDRRIGEIKPIDLLEVLRTVEARGVGETVHRLCGYAGAIFRFGIPEGVCERDIAHDIRDSLKRKPKVRNRAKFTAKELPTFLRKLDQGGEEEDTRDALLLTLLTAVRTTETRFAHRDEFENLDGAEPIWRLSKERMKMDREHLVPLSRQAVEVVQRRLALCGRSGLLFEAPTVSKVISENTMLFAIYRMGYHSRATTHGLRGTFSTIANESEDPSWEPDWIEMALAHKIPGVRGAYNAALYLPQRRRLLQWWADYLDAARAKR